MLRSTISSKIFSPHAAGSCRLASGAVLLDRGVRTPASRDFCFTNKANVAGRRSLSSSAAANAHMRAETRPEKLPGAFSVPPRTGVIYASSEAAKMGYSAEDKTWCNMGQGMPECGPLPGAPSRVQHIDISLLDTQYSPVAGIRELREAVATLYNELYRKDKESKYTADNVAICGGGRVALARVAAALGKVNVGHFLPDYSAYEELLGIFKDFKTIPILLEAERGWSLTPAEIRKEVAARGLAAILFSNPGNPTGKVVAGNDMRQWIEMGRELDCTLISDEFFSHYLWRKDLRLGGEAGGTGFFSTASYVDDVNADPVVIVNGMTKNWRLPGWRLCWNVGPKSVIQSVAASGSFLDGGGSRPLQRAAVDLLSPENTRKEMQAISETFSKKRDVMVAGLREMGIMVNHPPEGSFYIWAGIHGLPASINDGLRFFREALRHKVIVVPGEFFDVNPGRRRRGRFKQYLRFSFGPDMATCKEALRRLSLMIQDERLKEKDGVKANAKEVKNENSEEVDISAAVQAATEDIKKVIKRKARS